MKIEPFRKVRIYFQKTGDIRFLSHLDVMRTMDRALRRSRLPIRFTEGMNPKVKMSFPTALPLGMESRVENFEIQVKREIVLLDVRDRLAAELPEGLGPFDVDALYTSEKWRVAELHYEITGDLPPADAVEEFVNREQMPVLRKGKELDLRPLLGSLRHGGDRLILGIVWTEKGTARPDDFLRALAREPEDCRVVKVGITFETSFGERIMKTNGS